MRFIFNLFKLNKLYQELATTYSHQTLLVITQKERIAELEAKILRLRIKIDDLKFDNNNLYKTSELLGESNLLKHIDYLEEKLAICKCELAACVSNQPTRKEKRAERNKRGSQ